MTETRKLYRIKDTSAPYFSNTASTFAYAIYNTDETKQRVFISPVSTLKTGKATTFAQASKYCTWIKASSIEPVN